MASTLLAASSFDMDMYGAFTLLGTNIAPDNRPSQRKIHLSTIDFQWLCYYMYVTLRGVEIFLAARSL